MGCPHGRPSEGLNLLHMIKESYLGEVTWLQGAICEFALGPKADSAKKKEKSFRKNQKVPAQKIPT